MSAKQQNSFSPRLLVLFKFFIGWPISILALIFILKIVLPKTSIILPQFAQLNVPVLLLGIISFFLYFAFRALLWKKILHEKGFTVSYKETSFLWEMSELKRYVPGNIWSFLGRNVLFGKRGVDRRTVISSLLIEAELIVLSGMVFSLLPLPFLSEGLLHIVWNAPIAIGVSLIMMLICLFFICNRFVHKKVKSKSTLVSNLFLDSSPKDAALLLLFSFVPMFFFGLGTYFSIASIFYLNAYFFLTFVGFFVFALLIGYVSFITPMGLGVREGILTIGLAKVMPASSAGVASVFARIVFVISELLFALLITLWHYSKNTLVAKIETFISEHKHVIIVTTFVAVYWIYFTSVSFLRYDNFFTGRFDLGNMDQAVWNTLRGRIFQVTDPNGTNIISRLAFHADFLLILLAPLYKIWAHPKMLLLVQTLVLGSGGFFVYAIAKDTLKNKSLAVIFALLYLLNPAVEYTNLYDFHPVVLGTTFLLASWYFLQKEKYRWLLLFLVLAGLTKEDVWIITGLLGLYLALRKKKWLLGAGITAVSFGIFYYLIWHAIPAVRGSQHFALSYYSDFGDSPIKIIKNIFFQPQKTIQTILQKSQITYIVSLGLPFAFLPYIFPLFTIFALPTLAINLLSNNAQLHEIFFQYSATITPFLLISTIYAVKYLQQKYKRLSISTLSSLLLSFTVLSAYFLGPLPASRMPNIAMFTEQLAERKTIDDFLSSVSARYSIAATNNVGSHLSRRQRIYTIPVGIDKADIVVFLLNDPFAQPSLKTQRDMAQNMKHDKNYIEIFKQDDFIAFEKRNLYLQSSRTVQQAKLFPLSVPALLHRDYDNPTTTFEKSVASGNFFTSSIVSYQSDGLKLYALMNVPTAKMPENGYPVIILLHGYINPKDYDTVNSYKGIADYLSSAGFIVVKPDYRGNANSELDNQALMRFAYPIDVVNLLSAIDDSPNINKNNIFLWSHSMGGEVGLTALEIIGTNPKTLTQIRGAVFWAPVTDPLKWFGRNHLSALPESQLTPFPYTQTFKILGTPEKNPQVWQSLSPLPYLNNIQAPVQIDHGTGDTTVPSQWSIELYDDLLSLNKKATLNLYPDEDHNLSNAQEEALQKDIEFFKSNLAK